MTPEESTKVNPSWAVPFVPFSWRTKALISAGISDCIPRDNVEKRDKSKIRVSTEISSEKI